MRGGEQIGMSFKPFSQMNVLVTGASRGIGAAIAERFALAGMNVVIHYFRSHEDANRTARQCLENGAGTVLTVSADLSSAEEIRRMRDRLDTHGLMPDILVNNAGVAHYGLFTDLTEAEWDYVMNINLKATFLCSQTFVKYMIRQRYGRIINISSVWGITGASCEAAYSASKGGLNALTKALAKELAPSGITVNAVAPGAVETGMNDFLSEAEREALIREIPAGRFAKPEEIASMVYFLALPESGYITGQIMSPNGGWQV
jgi:3-oxoacyl-[acyl-carrier protein] reductase